MSESINRAKRLLQGESAPAAELLQLARKLKKEQKFDLARRILGLASQQQISDPDLRRTIQQQQASCTELSREHCSFENDGRAGLGGSTFRCL